jgi:hypothetical protein
MAEITSTRDDDLDNAARQCSGTYNNKYNGTITKESADDDDDHSGGIGGQTIEKMDGGLPKPYEEPANKNPALKESGKYSGIAQN